MPVAGPPIRGPSETATEVAVNAVKWDSARVPVRNGPRELVTGFLPEVSLRQCAHLRVTGFALG